MVEITTPDDNTEKSALKAADEVLGLCAAMLANKLTAAGPLITEAQRRIRRQTNPEVFDSSGQYR